MIKGNAKRRILFVVEGEKAEIKLVTSMMKALGLNEEYELVSYKANLHDMLDVLDRDYFGEYEDVDIRAVLASIKAADRQILLQDYSDIILIFDYDPQDNRFNPHRLEKLVATFNESTDRGKVYINYPMLESYKHFTAFDEDEYLNTVVDIKDISDYKRLVANCDTLLTTPKDLENGLILSCVVALNTSKIEKLTDSKTVLPKENLAERCAAVDLKSLLSLQNETWAHRGMVFVCNTSVLFISDWKLALNGMWKKALAMDDPRYSCSPS